MAKAMYIGVKSKSYMLTNLAPTINGTTGWSGVNGTISSSTSIKKYGAASMSLTATASQAEAYATNTTNINIQNAHTYYIAYYYYATGKFNTNAYLPVNRTAIMHASTTAAAAKTWYRHGVVYNYAKSSLPSATFSSSLRLDFNNNKVAGTMYFDGLMIIDLTEAFGSGNEPDATWCNANIPYFTGKTKVEKASSTSVARKVKKMYIGVNGVARRVKKAYIGVGGKARCFFGEGTLSYYGTTTSNLSKARSGMASATIGDYAIIAGGSNYDEASVTTVDVYNSSLTKVSASALSQQRRSFAAATFGGYAMFLGGYADGVITNRTDLYNASLTRTTMQPNYCSRMNHGMAVAGNTYAVIAGGNKGGYTLETAVAMNTSKTIVNAPSLTYGWEKGASVTFGDYAVFGGGSQQYENSGSFLGTVWAYDSSLTLHELPYTEQYQGATSATYVGNYVLFEKRNSSDKMYAYNKSFTQTIITGAATRDSTSATTVNGIALFCGGHNSSTNMLEGQKIVECFDTSLTMTQGPSLSAGRMNAAAVSVGNFALIAGGQKTIGIMSTPSTYSDTVDVYNVV